jgi:predicted Zn-dependent protease
MTRRSLVLIALLFAGLVGGIALPAQAQFGRLGDALNRGKAAADRAREAAAPFTPLTTEQEVAMGKEVAAKMIHYFKPFSNDKALAYVRKVGRVVALQSDRKDVKYRFDLLDTDDVNAFAAPGGYIFITRGLLENIQSEAQLAAVLAHEVGHVSGKHVIKQLETGQMVQAGLKRAESFTSGSQYLDQVAKEILARLIDRGLDHNSEYDADQRGANYVYAAGYRPDGMVKFLDGMQAAIQRADAKTSWLTRTHPPVVERIQRLEKLIADQKWQLEGRPDNLARYQATMKAAAGQ